MKRELIADLDAGLSPEFDREVGALRRRHRRTRRKIARRCSPRRIAERRRARASETLGAIDRARAATQPGDPAGAPPRAPRAKRLRCERLATRSTRAPSASRTRAARSARRLHTRSPRAGATAPRRSGRAFDPRTYEHGLRPERWRVAVLGAFRRGKSSLINAHRRYARARRTRMPAANCISRCTCDTAPHRERMRSPTRPNGTKSRPARCSTPRCARRCWSRRRGICRANSSSFTRRAFDRASPGRGGGRRGRRRRERNPGAVFASTFRARARALRARRRRSGKPMTFAAHDRRQRNARPNGGTVVDARRPLPRASAASPRSASSPCRRASASSLERAGRAAGHARKRMPRNTWSACARAERERRRNTIAWRRPPAARRTPPRRSFLDRLLGGSGRPGPPGCHFRDSRSEADVSDTSYVLGPARLAFGDGRASYGRIAVEHGRIAKILPAGGPSDCTPPGATYDRARPDRRPHQRRRRRAVQSRSRQRGRRSATRAYARMGATGYVAAVMTAPWESMMHAAAEISEAANATRRVGQLPGRALPRRSLRRPVPQSEIPPRASRRLDRSGDARPRARDDRGVPRRAGDGHDGARDGRRRRSRAAVFRSGHRVLGGPHLGALSRRHAGDRLGVPHAHARVQRDAAARPPRSLDSRRVHARIAHDRATDLRRLSTSRRRWSTCSIARSATGSCSPPTTCRRPAATTASKAASCAPKTVRSPAARCTSTKRSAT